MIPMKKRFQSFLVLKRDETLLTKQIKIKKIKLLCHKRLHCKDFNRNYFLCRDHLNVVIRSQNVTRCCISFFYKTRVESLASIGK